MKRQNCQEELFTSCSSSSSSKSFDQTTTKLHTRCGISSVYTSKSKSNLEMIEQLTKLHDKLCDTAKYVEEYFTIQMLAVISVVFLIIVFNLFYMLEVLLCPNSESMDRHFQKWQFLLFFFLYSLKHSFAILGIVYTSCSVYSEVDTYFRNFSSKGSSFF